MRTKITKLRHELENAKMKLAVLDEERTSLLTEVQHLETKNKKLELFKANLVSTIKESETDETSTYTLSSRSTPTSSQSKIPTVGIQSKVASPLTKYSDGKRFFSEARGRLSYETFTRFLSYVKMLNDKSISKESALAEVRELFGEENSELYSEFGNLIAKR